MTIPTPAPGRRSNSCGGGWIAASETEAEIPRFQPDEITMLGRPMGIFHEITAELDEPTAAVGGVPVILSATIGQFTTPGIIVPPMAIHGADTSAERLTTPIPIGKGITGIGRTPMEGARPDPPPMLPTGPARRNEPAGGPCRAMRMSGRDTGLVLDGKIAGRQSGTAPGFPNRSNTDIFPRSAIGRDQETIPVPEPGGERPEIAVEPRGSAGPVSRLPILLDKLLTVRGRVNQRTGQRLL